MNHVILKLTLKEAQQVNGAIWERRENDRWPGDGASYAALLRAHIKLGDEINRVSLSGSTKPGHGRVA